MTASTWDDICTTVDSFAKKLNRQAEQLTESAAIRLKISARKAELEEEYTTFGKLAFEHTYMPTEPIDPTVPDSDALDGKIAASVARIVALREEIRALETKTEK